MLDKTKWSDREEISGRDGDENREEEQQGRNAR